MKLSSFRACSVQSFSKILKKDSNIKNFIILSFFAGYAGDLVTHLGSATLEI